MHSLIKSEEQFQNTVRPLLSGHARDFEDWPLNRGWLFNRGMQIYKLSINGGQRDFFLL